MSNTITLPEKYRELIDLIGLEKTITLCEEFGGTSLYIPKLDSYERLTRNKSIIADYHKGYTYTELSRQYNLTTVSIRNIISSCWLLIP